MGMNLSLSYSRFYSCLKWRFCLLLSLWQAITFKHLTSTWCSILLKVISQLMTIQSNYIDIYSSLVLWNKEHYFSFLYNELLIFYMIFEGPYKFSNLSMLHLKIKKKILVTQKLSLCKQCLFPLLPQCGDSSSFI